ncbi:hypothetical protein H6790_02120 [Candidatus Nomurabacteria bacterium]|nr:hypothetical protein [Candidatus Nomurabacteria bacterium]MCB9820719.1 hypothetical protein [Candidatus Nomurabacteria bacterium]
MKIDFGKYILVFFITAVIFISALLLSNFFANKKLAEIKNIQESISLDILSSETQYTLLSQLSCKDTTGALLSDELNKLAHKIEYSENNLSSYSELEELKDFYFLLEIKDFLLMKKINKECDIPLYTVLYFYGDAKSCTDCEKQSYVLTDLRDSYDELRVYSFDFYTTLSAVNSLKSIYKVEEAELPILVIDDEVYTGFQSVEDVEGYLPKELLDSKNKEEENIDLTEEIDN